MRVNSSAAAPKQTVTPVKPLQASKTVATTTSNNAAKPNTAVKNTPSTSSAKAKPAPKANATTSKPASQNAKPAAQNAAPKTSTTVASTIKPATQPVQTAQSANTQAAIQESIEGVVPTFKVQIFAVNRRLRPGSEQFKGHDDVDFYQDGNTYKYTIGASTDYNEIVRLKKKLTKDFPESFVIAFNGTQKMNTSLAIAAFVKNAKKGK